VFESPWHWIVLAIVAAVLFFGWKQLPDMSRSLGRSLRIFKTEIKGMSQDDKAREEAEAAEVAAPRELPPGSSVAPPAVSVEKRPALPRADVVGNRPRPRPTPGGATPSAQAAQPAEPTRSVGQ
jgi:sec-independent protein translocase protein TatA